MCLPAAAAILRGVPHQGATFPLVLGDESLRGSAEECDVEREVEREVVRNADKVSQLRGCKTGRPTTLPEPPAASAEVGLVAAAAERSETVANGDGRIAAAANVEASAGEAKSTLLEAAV